MLAWTWRSRGAPRLGQVEMREIEAFLAVADELHFGRAAQRLHVTTASVSQAIRALERRVGGPLFERTSRQVLLTPVGTDFLARVRPAHQQLADALREARRAGGLRYREALRAGFANTLPPDVVPRVTGAFTDQAPDCQLIRFDYPASDLLRWFETGQFEAEVCVAFIPDPRAKPRPAPEWVGIGPVLFTESRSALMGARHPLAGRSSVDVEELIAYDVLRPWGFQGFADGWFPAVTPGGQPTRRVQQSRITYMEDLRTLLGDGTLIHLAATSATVRAIRMHPGLVAVPVTGLPPLACATLWAKDNENPLIETFTAATAAEYAS
jgi:DNA-binding transcriptional LysR family regulator